LLEERTSIAQEEIPRNVLMKLARSYLVRTGYAKTLKAFDASSSLTEDDIPRDDSTALMEESAPWRQEIRQDIIAGDILKAIAILETHCPANYNGRLNNVFCACGVDCLR